VGVFILLLAIVVIIAIILANITEKRATKLKAKREADYRANALKAKRDAEIRLVEQKAAEIVEFRKEFPVHSQNPNVQEEWEMSCVEHDDHDSSEQIERQKRALDKFVTPIMINYPRFHNTLFLHPSAMFLSSSHPYKLYDTSLMMCDCPDNKHRDLPCKHMYRLFYEIEHPRSTNLEITDIDSDIQLRFRQLSDNERLFFVEKSLRYHFQPLIPRIIKKDAIVKSLIKNGFFIIIGNVDYAPMLEKMTKDQIILSLAKRNVDGYKPSWSKVKLIDWIVNEQSAFLKKHFKSLVSINIHPSVEAWAKGISYEYDKRWSNVQQ